MLSPQSQQPQQDQQEQERHSQQTQRMPGQKPPKLRTSCDSCAAAKVRCSKERPRCERCIECNFSCVYGLSMKHGKGSKKRRHQAYQPATDGFQSISVSSEQKYDGDLQQSFSDLLEDIGSTANISSTLPWPSGLDNPLESIAMHSTPPATASLTFGDPIWSNAIPNSHADTSSTGTIRPTSHGPASAYLESLDDSLSLLSSADLSHFINFEPSNSTSSSSSSASPVPPNKNVPMLLPQISNDDSGTHDCYMIASSTLAILHVSSRPMSSDSGNDTIYTFSPNATTRVPMQDTQHLDEVLRCTREAMGNVLHLLRCSCAGDPQMVMLHASIIIRILFWHQLAAGVRISTSCPLSSWGGSSIMDPFAEMEATASRSHWSSCSTPTALVASEPIKIGNYIPDLEDQEPMRRLFLLISLKKLGRLVEIFAQVGDPVDAGPGHIRGMLASWLDSELSQTIKLVGKGPTVMNRIGNFT